MWWRGTFGKLTLRRVQCTSCGVESFVYGMNKRMEDKVHQYKAINLDVVHKLIDELEIDFGQVVTENIKERVVDMTVFILASFLGGLRVDQTLKLVLGETRDFINESEKHLKDEHVVLPLRGRFKGEMEKVSTVWL